MKNGLNKRKLSHILKLSPEFIGWALQPPGWIKEWHCGVRNPCSVLLFTLHSKKKEVVNISFQGAGS